jgi:biotin carboxyl carrier protein
MTISLPAGPVPGPVSASVSEEYDWDAELGAALAGELPEWRLVVAPQRGIFHSAVAGDHHDRTVVGHIEARRDRQAIVAPWRGAIIEWLVQDGDPVALGQPVARLLPDAPSDAPSDGAE